MSRLVLALAGLSFCLAGLALLLVDLPQRRILHIADRVRSGVSLTVEEAASLQMPAAQSRVTCRRDLQSANMDVALARLDTLFSNPSQPDDLDRAYETARSAWIQDLSCFPFDGLAWTSAAMAIAGLEGPTEEAFQYVRLSQLTIPRDERALKRRIFLLITLTQTGREEADEMLRADIRTYLQWALPRRVTEFYNTLGAYGQARVQQELLAADFKAIMSAQDPLRYDVLLRNLQVIDPQHKCSPMQLKLRICGEGQT